MKNWEAKSESKFPWEREALDYLRSKFPQTDNYHAWSNFEFISEDGNIYEVDLLVFTPQGFFLVEIKSRPGRLFGDAGTWTWDTDGRLHTQDNPLLLANTKAKKLRSLLMRQKATKSSSAPKVPFVEALVFCSAPGLKVELSDLGPTRVCLRDKEGRPREAPGIMAALLDRKGVGLEPQVRGQHDRAVLRMVNQAMAQAGIRTQQRRLQVSDYVLEKLLTEGPGYQDWEARHVSLKDTCRRIRLYSIGQDVPAEERAIVARAAEREYRILESLHHPGVLRALHFTGSERGPAVIYDHDPEAVRLDHFLLQNKGKLPLDVQLALIRQIADVIRFAHEQRVVHRALCPQSVLVSAARGELRIKVFNWQVGFRTAGSSGGPSRHITATDHLEMLVEGASTAYLAPEAFVDGGSAGDHLDVFSLGALAYHIFSGVAPAANAIELAERLRESQGLRISAVLNGAPQQLEDLIFFATAPDVSTRYGHVSEFLKELDELENQLTSPDQDRVADPTQAKVGEQLEGGFVVVRQLGKGGCSHVLLVKQDDEELVLKAALTPDHNDRIRAEGEVLQKLRHQYIVEYQRTVTVGERTCLLMKQAGIETLAARLRKEGRLLVEMLQRFGDDLLNVLNYLEEQGISHRDIKPDNIGIGPVGRGDALHVILFDFSLSRTPVENIRAGTNGYLDPMLPLRKRWDLHAERYAAAMTLYEMATGTLPRWGDGRSEPSQLTCEISLEPEFFEPALREPLMGFFTKALRRDAAQRFDNAEEMRRAWQKCFEGIEQSDSVSEHETEEELRTLLAGATLDSQMIEFGLGTRAMSVLDRTNIQTVSDLLDYPLRRLLRQKGVGNKTRRELANTVKILREITGYGRGAGTTTSISSTALTEDEDEFPSDLAAVPTVGLPGVDHLVNVVLRQGSRQAQAETSMIHTLLGVGSEEGERWPSQVDIGKTFDVSRQRIGQVLTKYIKRWKDYAGLTGLRAAIAEWLAAHGGVMTLEELTTHLLNERGSVYDEPQRSQFARAVLRAAFEVERSLQEPRFVAQREGERVVFATSPEGVAWARALGRAADGIAGEDPLLDPARAVHKLREVEPPAGSAQIPEARLLRLAASLSQGAAVSARNELYPRGMAPERALRLSQGVLYGSATISVEKLRERVMSRYPDAARLPDRPELDALLREAGLEFSYDHLLDDGKGAYRTSLSSSTSARSSNTHFGRYATRHVPAEMEIRPEVADARNFEERLVRAQMDGSFLALVVDPRRYQDACDELLRRFDLELIDVEALFLEALRAEAKKAGADWQVVLAADRVPGQGDWAKLLMLVRRAMPTVEQRIGEARKVALLVFAGVLARYDQMGMLERLRDASGRAGGLPGVWLLVPGSTQAELEGKAIPVLGPGQRVRVPVAWIHNEHRAGVEPVPLVR